MGSQDGKPLGLGCLLHVSPAGPPQAGGIPEVPAAPANALYMPPLGSGARPSPPHLSTRDGHCTSLGPSLGPGRSQFYRSQGYTSSEGLRRDHPLRLPISGGSRHPWGCGPTTPSPTPLCGQSQGPPGRSRTIPTQDPWPLDTTIFRVWTAYGGHFWAPPLQGLGFPLGCLHLWGPSLQPSP